MTDIPQWQTTLLGQWANAPFEELLDECLSQAQGNSWDGNFTAHGWNEYQFLVALLKERMKKETL